MGTKIVNYSNKGIRMRLVYWKNHSNFIINEEIVDYLKVARMINQPCIMIVLRRP